MSRSRFLSFPGVTALELMAVMLYGCAPTVAAPQPTSMPTGTLPMASPTHRSTPAASPTTTFIPGFEGWAVINPQDVRIQTKNGSVVMTLTHRALWFMEQRGVLFYTGENGDFQITADVHASKSSDPSQPPGGDGSVQLGGLMVRSGEGAQENYVFIVVGDDGDGLSVETKNTVNSLSKFAGPEWDSPAAELRLCRFGQTVSLYKRHIGTNEPWLKAASFERADLPDHVQIGVNIYTDGAPDLQVRYDNIGIDAIQAQADCER